MLSARYFNTGSLFALGHPPAGWNRLQENDYYFITEYYRGFLIGDM